MELGLIRSIHCHKDTNTSSTVEVGNIQKDLYNITNLWNTRCALYTSLGVLLFSALPVQVFGQLMSLGHTILGM